MLSLLDQANPFVADEAEAAIASAAVQKLKAVAEAKQDIRIIVQDDLNIVVPLPARAVALIVQVLESMSERIPISLIPHEAELTTQQAADYLNVSRPFLASLVDKNLIAHRMVGSHRRIRFGDLVAFEQKSRKDRQAALVQMADEAKKLGLE